MIMRRWEAPNKARLVVALVLFVVVGLVVWAIYRMASRPVFDGLPDDQPEWQLSEADLAWPGEALMIPEPGATNGAGSTMEDQVSTEHPAPLGG